MGLWMAGIGTILGAVNFITTIICMRAPGMTMFRMPIFVWNVLITSLLVLMAFPILGGALLSLEADRLVGAHIFDAEHGGAVLWRSEEHTTELQSLMRIAYAVFCLNTKIIQHVQAT